MFLCLSFLVCEIRSPVPTLSSDNPSELKGIDLSCVLRKHGLGTGDLTQ